MLNHQKEFFQGSQPLPRYVESLGENLLMSQLLLTHTRVLCSGLFFIFRNGLDVLEEKKKLDFVCNFYRNNNFT